MGHFESKIIVRPQSSGSTLTHFQPMFHFYAFWKHQKTSGFLLFSGGI